MAAVGLLNSMTMAHTWLNQLSNVKHVVMIVCLRMAHVLDAMN
jgi:hypothetical protein